MTRCRSRQAHSQVCWVSWPEGLQAVGVAQCHTQTLGQRLDDDFASRASLAIFPGGFLPGCDAAQTVSSSCNVLSWTSERPSTRPSTLPSDALVAKGVPTHRVAIHAGSTRCQSSPWSSTGAPEPLVFTVLVDEILGSLVSEWSCDNLLVTFFAFADDVLLFDDSLEILIRTFDDLLCLFRTCWSGGRC